MTRLYRKGRYMGRGELWGRKEAKYDPEFVVFTLVYILLKPTVLTNLHPLPSTTASVLATYMPPTHANCSISYETASNYGPEKAQWILAYFTWAK